MKIVTWNVNSIRARIERLLALLDRHAPDVVCLQEIKVASDAFPYEAIADAGYQSAVYGQKTYNGVAILSKASPDAVAQGFDDGGDETQARALSASFGATQVVCVYVPNGKSVENEAYGYKLEWLARLRDHVDRIAKPDQEIVVLGDFNVAPADADVHDPEAWRDAILCSGPERQALCALEDWGLRDAFRALHPDSVAFTWWDYRQLGFPKNRGLRIDHLWMSPPLLARCSSVEVDRDERKGKGPSDHAPVVAILD